jgi:methanogenic corrinoid protein MtbC1
VVPLSLPELEVLGDQAALQGARRQEPVLDAEELRAHVELIRNHDAPRLRSALTRHLSRVGVARFVNDVLSPLNAAVGEAWMRGHLEIFEEHLYSEAVQVVLRAAIASVPEHPDPNALRVLLTTFPGEPHGLGLLMVEALLAMEGCRCTSLGPQTPLLDIVRAAAAVKADVVALSFTGCLGANQVADGLAELRMQLPPSVALWVGGQAPVLQRRALPGLQVFADLRNVAAAVVSATQAARP